MEIFICILFMFFLNILESVRVVSFGICCATNGSSIWTFITATHTLSMYRYTSSIYCGKEETEATAIRYHRFVLVWVVQTKFLTTTEKFFFSFPLVGNSILDMEFLQENFDGDLEEYEREAEELTEAQLTVYRVTTYPRKTWKKNFFSDEEFRRKVVMPARKLILAEGGVTEISKEE